MQLLIARTKMPSKLTTGHEANSKNKPSASSKPLQLLWALPPVALILSGFHSCTHWHSWYHKLRSFVSRKKKKKKLQWLSAELRDEAPRHEREWVEKKNGTWPNYMIRGREPRASAARWQSSQPQRNTDMNVITLCLPSLPEMKARVEDQSICLKLDSQIRHF